MQHTAIARPRADEYGDAYAAYIALVPEGDLLAELEAQRGDLQARLSRLDDAAARRRYAAGKWSIKEVVGHVIDCEIIMSCRALCFARGELHQFPGFDQDDYVAAAAFDRQPLAALRRQHAAVRDATLSLFAALAPAAWAKRGVANDCEFSVRALAYIIVGHERHHLGILEERYGVRPIE